MPKRREPTLKKINFVLIPPDSKGKEAEPYTLMKEVRSKWHPELREANIALAWRKSLKPDVDGHLMLGKCVKASDLQRELIEYDFVILINKEVWNDEEFTREKKTALLDHELCHAEPALDKEYRQKRDEKDRQVWRVRKHDIEEFKAVVERHGCYKADLEKFAEALLKAKNKPPLIAAMEGDKKSEFQKLKNGVQLAQESLKKKGLAGDGKSAASGSAQ